jgi:hypothetical protein
MAESTWRRASKCYNVVLLLLAALAPAQVATARGNRLPDLGDCEHLQPPAGHKVALHTYAEGVQIYRWNGTSWAFVAPDAVLYTGRAKDGNGVVGIHYAGPTWESNSGSKVVAAVVDRCTTDTDAIPWLLLESVSSEGPGIFHRVTYIQRLFTTGGLAPADAGDFLGEEAHAPYTAWYVFYRQK